MALTDPLFDLADLVLGRSCRGCGAIGRDLCADCLAACRSRARPCRPSSATADVWVGSAYAGLVRRLLLAYKDGQRSLARPLGILLADVVCDALTATGHTRGFLVRIPGHRRPARGFDALGLVVRHTAIELRRRDVIAPSLGVLVRRHERGPSKALTRDARFAALTDAFEAQPTRAEVGLPAQQPIVVVDDVMTTGATMAEAMRALRSAGLEPRCGAVIAAVDRRGGDQPG